MPKLVAVLDTNYDASTNAVSDSFQDADGNKGDLQIDGLAFFSMLALASIGNIRNAAFRHLQVGSNMHLLGVDAIQTGTASFGVPKQYGMSLSLSIPQMGILDFFLPLEIEMGLREKLQRPRSVS